MCIYTYRYIESSKTRVCSLPTEILLFICEILRALDNPLSKGLDLSNFSWPDWNNRRIMCSPSLTRLSCISRHFRAMLKSEVFRKIQLSSNSIQRLFENFKRWPWEDQKLFQILPFVRELAIRPVNLHTGMQAKEFLPAHWPAVLSRVLRSAPLLERLHLYEVRFNADVLEAIQQCNLVHLLTYQCSMYDDSDTPGFPPSRNPRLKTVCHFKPSWRNQGLPSTPAVWPASFFVPSLTHLILDSTPGQSSDTLRSLSVLPRLRHLSVSYGRESQSDVSDQVGAVLGGSKDLEELHVKSGTRASLQIACPPLPRLRRISCQLWDLHKLLPGNYIEELELDADRDNSEATPDQLITTIQAGKGIIKKLVCLPTFMFRIPCTVVSGLVKALPCLQELRLVIKLSDIEEALPALFPLKSLQVLSLLDRPMNQRRDLEWEEGVVGRLESSGVPLKEIVLFPNEPWVKGTWGWSRHQESQTRNVTRFERRLLDGLIWSPVASGMHVAMAESSNDISLLSGSPKPTFIHPNFDFSDADVILSVTGRCSLEGSGSREGEADSSFQISPNLRKWMEKEDPERHHGTTLFRVHKCALSQASGLFADMFTLPQPSTQDTIDGLPVIHMHDDPIDICGFLVDLYNEESLEHHPLRQTTFNRMSSLVRLSRKYSLVHLAATALASIRSDWPTTFEEWERTELQRAWMTYANARTCSKPHDGGTGRGPGSDVVEPCGVIRFAREEGIPEILPATFYHLSRLSSLNRPLRPEPDTEGQKHSHECSVEGRGYAMTSVMTPADWATLMIGKGEIRSWFVEFRQYGWQSIHAKNCEAEDPSSCVLSAQGGWKTYWEEIVEERTRKVLAQDGLDVLEILRDLGHFVLYDENLCPRCRIRAGITVDSARLAFWDGLPDFFRLKRPNPWGGTWMEGEPVDCFEQSI